MADSRGGSSVKADVQTAVSAAWTSATSVDTAISIPITGMATVVLTLNPTTTFSAGTLVFEFSDDDGTTWYPGYMQRLSTGVVEASYAIVASTKVAWRCPSNALTDFRVRLSIAITGSGTANVKLRASAAASLDSIVNPNPSVVTANAGTNLNTSALALDATLGTTNTDLGATNESAAATDTSTSGLNGLVKRLLQRITSLIALLPTSLGQKTMANSLAVVVASDQSGVPVKSDVVTATTAGWTSGTATDTALTLSAVGMATAVASMSPSISLSIGLAFEVSDDGGTTWYDIPAQRLTSGSVDASGLTYGGATKIAWRFSVAGFTNVRLRLSSAVSTGTATVSLQVSAAAAPGPLTVVLGSTGYSIQLTGSALTALQLIDDPVIADDAAFTPATSKVTMAGFEFDDSSPDSVDEGDAGAARMSANRNQYVTIRDAAGNERGVNINASNQLAVAGPVTNAGTFAVQVDGAALTALQLIDDPVIADDTAFTPATSKVMMAGFEFDDSSPDSVDEGDAGAARMSANRSQYVQLRDAAGNERGANVNAQNQLAVAGPVTNAGTFAVQDSEKIADNGGFTDGTTKVVPVGLIYDEVAGTALTENDIGTPRMNVNRGSVSVIEDGSTRARYATVTASNALKTDGSAVTQPVAGDVAHDGVDSGNPQKIGAQARTSDITAVASADRVNSIATILGKLIVKLDAVPDLTWNYPAPAGGLVTTSGVTAKAASGAGIRNYVKSIQVINSHATISTEVAVKDGAAGTVLHRGWAQAAGGGYALTFDPPLRGTANTLVEIAEVTATASTGVLVNLQGYTAAE